MRSFRKLSAVMMVLLAIVANLAENSWAQQAAEDNPQVAVFTVKGMCCAKESGPAIKELSKIAGVAKVIVSHKSGTLTIVAKEEMYPSPIGIWEALERVENVQPLRLATIYGTFTRKPRLSLAEQPIPNIGSLRSPVRLVRIGAACTADEMPIVHQTNPFIR